MQVVGDSQRPSLNVVEPEVLRCDLRRPYILPGPLPNSSIHYSSSFLKCAGDPIGMAVRSLEICVELEFTV